MISRGYSAAVLACLALAGSGVFGVPAAQDGGTWTTHLYMNNIGRIAVADDGVWCATDGGALFYEFATSRFSEWHRGLGALASDSLTDVEVLADGQVAFATVGSGLSIYQPERDVWLTQNSLTWPIAGDEVRFVREVGPWRIIGSSNGVLVQEGDQARVICQKDFDPCGLPTWDVIAAVWFMNSFWFATAEDESGPGAIGRLNTSLGAWNTVQVPGSLSDLVVWGDSLYCACLSGVYVWKDNGWADRSAGLTDQVLEVRELFAGGRLLAAAWGTDGGPFAWDPAGQRWERLADGRLRGCASIAEGVDGIVWVGVRPGWTTQTPWLPPEEDGLWELVGTTWVQHRHLGPHPVADYRGLSLDDSGRLWGATAGRHPLGWRILSFDDGEWSFYNSDNAPLSRGWGWHVRVLGDRVWLGHCCCVEPAQGCELDDWRIGSMEAVAHDSVYNIHASAVDARGNLWFSSNRENPEEYPDVVKGLFHYDRGQDRWRHYDIVSTQGRMVSNAVTSVAVQGDTLWVGYASHGVHRVLLDAAGQPRLESSAWRLYQTSDGLAGDRIAKIVTRPGQVWVGTDNGISLRQGIQWLTFRAASGQLPGNTITDLALTSDGAVWAGVHEVGVARIARGASGAWSEFETHGPPDLVNPYVRFVVAGAEGRDVWVATTRGLSHFVPSPALSDDTFEAADIYPNPFTPACDGDVRFVDLPGRAREGVVADTNGRLVGRFSEVWAGEPFWDGKDLDGNVVAPGLYVVRVSTPQGWLTGQIAILDLPCQ